MCHLFTPASMIVSYTDYNTALVYFCFRYRPGRKDQCQRKGWQAEVMSRSIKPKKKVVKDYLRRAQKRLCVAPKDIYPTKAGMPRPFKMRQIKSISMSISGENADRTESS